MYAASRESCGSVDHVRPISSGANWVVTRAGRSALPSGARWDSPTWACSNGLGQDAPTAPARGVEAGRVAMHLPRRASCRVISSEAAGPRGARAVGPTFPLPSSIRWNRGSRSAFGRGKLFGDDFTGSPGLYLVEPNTGFERAIAAIPFGLLSNLVLMNPVGAP